MLCSGGVSLSRIVRQPPQRSVCARTSASLSALAKTINGEIDYEPKNFKTNGKVFIVTLNDGTKFEENFRHSITILSDGNRKQRQLLEE